MTSIIKVDNIQDSGGTAAISIDSAGRVDMANSYVYDLWYLNANHTTDGDSDLTAWTQAGSSLTGTGNIGSMSVSSGVFTFPMTGFYKVTHYACFRVDANDNVTMKIKVTTDNSAYSDVAVISAGGSDTVNTASSGACFLNVTDTSNIKFKIEATSLDSGTYIIGNSSTTRTSVLVERLAPAQ